MLTFYGLAPQIPGSTWLYLATGSALILLAGMQMFRVDNKRSTGSTSRLFLALTIIEGINNIAQFLSSGMMFFDGNGFIGRSILFEYITRFVHCMLFLVPMAFLYTTLINTWEKSRTRPKEFSGTDMMFGFTAVTYVIAVLATVLAEIISFYTLAGGNLGYYPDGQPMMMDNGVNDMAMVQQSNPQMDE